MELFHGIKLAGSCVTIIFVLDLNAITSLHIVLNCCLMLLRAVVLSINLQLIGLIGGVISLLLILWKEVEYEGVEGVDIGGDIRGGALGTFPGASESFLRGPNGFTIGVEIGDVEVVDVVEVVVLVVVIDEKSDSLKSCID